MIAHATEEHVIPEVTSRNNRGLREAAFSSRSVRQLRDTTIIDMLREVFSVLFVPRCYKQDKSRV
jgi:hypothetical protein